MKETFKLEENHWDNEESSSLVETSSFLLN
jgi:hypothetical protein